jgi:ankyrin repeat protein
MLSSSGSLRTARHLFRLALVLMLGFANAPAADDAKTAALHDACRRSDLAGLRAALAGGAPDLDAKSGESKWSALHWAAQGRASRQDERRAVVAELLRAGADVHALTAKNESVFEIACAPGWDAQLLVLLLGNTALHRAVRASNNAGVQTLLLLGANAGVLNRDEKRQIEIEGADRLDAGTLQMLDRYTPALPEPPTKPTPRAPEPPRPTKPPVVALR